MITFKNRYAEFDNLDDSYNQNVLRNCYNKEYRKNFLGYKNSSKNKPINLRYMNFNDTRAINLDNYNKNYNSFQRQNAYTPFPKLPPINNNSNNYINYNNNMPNNDQNFLPSRSFPNMPSALNYNYYYNLNQRQTPSPRYNNNFFNNNSFDYDVNNSNLSNDNILNISNDSQYNDSSFSILRSLENELEELEKERKLLNDQEILNQMDFELRYLRQKRNADLQRRLAEHQRKYL